VTLQALQMVNACSGVAVTSVAKDGAAPELNPGWVHRRINSYTAAGQTALQSS